MNTTMTNTSSPLKNPHLPGEPFFWQGGPTGVLLIHGFTATTAEVRPLAKRLHARGYSVSGPLLPGHGTTPADANHYTWKDWVTTAEDAYRELSARCERVYVGGESTGGLLALHLAIHHPEVGGVLAYAPALELTLTRGDRLKAYLAAPFIAAVPKGLSDDDIPWQGYWDTPLRALIQLLRFQKHVKRRLHQLRRPLLIVQGELDERVPPHVPETIARMVQSSLIEIHWMERSSHVVILDRELDQVAELTLQFIAKTTV